MTAKEFDPAAFYVAWCKKRGGTPISSDEPLRALAAEAAKQQARKDADRCRATQTDGMSVRDGAYDQGCEDCAQAIEKEAGL